MSKSIRAGRSSARSVLGLGFAALSSWPLASCDDAPTRYSATPPDVVDAVRPAEVFRPVDYDPTRAYPLLLLLHGYGVNGFLQDIYFGTTARVDTHDFILVVPNGTLDPDGKRFWNAGPCCTFGANPPDDVAYLRGLVRQVSETHHVDRHRVYALGHSNGGFMALRLACDASDTFVAVASLAGAAPPTELDCAAAEDDVSVLAMHGDADDVVFYDGVDVPTGIVVGVYPSAPETARRFAARLGCTTEPTPTAGPLFDFDAQLAGDETTPIVYSAGCAPGTVTELWTIAGGTHIPAMRPETRDRILDWLLSRQR